MRNWRGRFSGLEPGAWSLEPGAWSLEPGAWSLEPGAWSLDPRPLKRPRQGRQRRFDWE